jgi:hypothetical protein
VFLLLRLIWGLALPVSAWPLVRAEPVGARSLDEREPSVLLSGPLRIASGCLRTPNAFFRTWGIPLRILELSFRVPILLCSCKLGSLSPALVLLTPLEVTVLFLTLPIFSLLS